MEPAIDRSLDKNAALKARFGFGFERVLVALADGGLLDERTHPNKEKYGHQRQLVVDIEGYAWIVPFAASDYGVFFKALFPSRKATRDYLGARQ